MATFGERLNEALAYRNMSAADLSRLAEVNEGAISQYRKGKYKASQQTVHRIARVLNVPIAWLMGMVDESPFDLNANIQEDEIIKKFRVLSPDHKQLLLTMLDSMYQQDLQNGEKTERASSA